MMSASREKTPLVEASMARVKQEEDDELQELEKEPQQRGASVDDEDRMTISQYMISRATLHASLVVEEEMPSEAYQRTEANNNSPQCPLVEAQNVASRTKRSRRTSSDGHFQVLSPSIMDQAKEVQANLNPEFPSFIKLLLRSHVSGPFWLRLPKTFCKQHMPKQDETVVLVGENGEGHRAKFLANKSALSGGWRGFSLAHELQAGDIVVFQLVRPCEFKVYIVRGNALADLDGATDLLDLDGNARESSIELDGGSLKKHRTGKKAEGKNINPELDCDNAPTDTATSFLVANSQCENCGEDSQPESMDCSSHARPFIDFQGFNITVNGLAIDSELPKNVRTKYYELCCSQKSFLHNHLLRTINPRLAAEMISETVNIADAIQACGLFTSQADFTIWEKTLEGFKLLGMDVGFLCARLNQLVNLAAASTETPEFKKYNEARLQQTRLEEDIMELETTLAGLKHAKNMLNSEIDMLKTNVQRYESIFEEAAHVPW